MHQQQEDLNPVGPRGRVLERMRRVRVEEAAAVGAQVLDGFLAGHRAAVDGLLGTAQRGDDLIVQVEVLDRAADDQDDGRNNADRHQDAQHRAHQVDPEVTQIAGALAGEAAHQCDRHRHADGGRDEVLHRQPGHLHQMTIGGLTGVGLPVGVGDEADRGVPRQRRGHLCGRIMQMQRQLALHQLEDEQEQDADRRESQDASGVGAPRLLRAWVNTDQPIDHPLDTQVLFRRVHPIHVIAEGHMHHHQCHHENDKEDDPCCCCAH